MNGLNELTQAYPKLTFFAQATTQEGTLLSAGDMVYDKNSDRTKPPRKIIAFDNYQHPNGQLLTRAVYFSLPYWIFTDVEEIIKAVNL